MSERASTPDPIIDREPANEDVAEIRYGLTALGEALVAERTKVRFRGFGPCSIATLKIAG